MRLQVLGIRSRKFGTPVSNDAELLDHREIVLLVRRHVKGVRDNQIDEVVELLRAAHQKVPDEDGDEREVARRDCVDFSIAQYLTAMKPNCGWEIASTLRFDQRVPQGKVIARKPLEQGQLVELLTGNLLKVTEEMESNLCATGRDFSIIMWNKQPHILVGRLRYVNHSCDPNTRFQSQGHLLIGLKTQRPIRVGEEITVRYREDYRGLQDEGCRCDECSLNTAVSDQEHGEICLTKEPELRGRCRSCWRHQMIYGLAWPMTSEPKAGRKGTGPTLRSAGHG